MRPDLPSGTVTILITDVEGSTKLLHSLGAEGYADALAEHRRVIREACAAQGGVEVDTQGDAFFFAFPTAPGAVAAAATFTEGLAPGPIAVRVGLHTGTPLLTDEGYVGGDVHRAARIAASGHGGQVLVSASTAQLVELELRDLGEHRLKDLSAPERIFQLGEGEFPALKSLYRTNLPVPATAFLGREAELAEVVSLLEDARLLTLTGPGGTGKTRLALQAAGLAADAYPDGVFWIPLAPLRDPELVLASAGQTLGSKNGLAEHIADKRMLCLFDNFEQVVEAGPELAALVSACSNLDVLVTSRERLRVSGEQTYPVPQLAESDGEALFLARARAVDPAFPWSDAVRELCARLDELPLALELAAARTGLFSPEQLLAKLSQRLDLLKGERDADPRQQTLRATIEWSYELLSEEEQRLFRRLAVFAGGCTYEAAEEIAGADPDTLQSLLDKSLLRKRDSKAGPRYWMLETIREYAAEKLETSGEAEELRRRHAEWVLALARASRRPLRGPEQGLWLERMRREEDNLRLALTWAIETEHGCLAAALAWALEVLWIRAQRWGEAEGWLDRVLQLECAEAPREWARALATGGVFATSAEVRATRFTASIPVLREHEDRDGLAFALRGLSWHLEMAGELGAARVALEEAVDLFEALGHTVATRRVGLGSLAFKEGDRDGARRLLQLALDTAEREGDATGQIDAFTLLGKVALAEGDLDEAERAYRAGAEVARQLGDEQVTVLLVGLAAVALRRGRAAEAGRLWGEAERLATEADPSVQKYLEANTLPVDDLTADEQAEFEAFRASASVAAPTP